MTFLTDANKIKLWLIHAVQDRSESSIRKLLFDEVFCYNNSRLDNINMSVLKITRK